MHLCTRGAGAPKLPLLTVKRVTLGVRIGSQNHVCASFSPSIIPDSRWLTDEVRAFDRQSRLPTPLCTLRFRPVFCSLCGRPGGHPLHYPPAATNPMPPPTYATLIRSAPAAARSLARAPDVPNGAYLLPTCMRPAIDMTVCRLVRALFPPRRRQDVPCPDRCGGTQCAARLRCHAWHAVACLRMRACGHHISTFVAVYSV